VPIEKAFAISASPREIFAAIDRDLASASAYAGDTHDVLRRDGDRLLTMRVTMGFVPCMLTYRMEPKSDHTEVVASLEPFGWRAAVFNITTLGMRKQNFEIALVEALANLKAAVEEDAARFPDEEGRIVSAPEE
jgi:hypothetical protein